jgi:hypothetical protein
MVLMSLQSPLGWGIDLEEASDVSVIFMCVVSIKGSTILMRIVPHLKNIYGTIIMHG